MPEHDRDAPSSRDPGALSGAPSSLDPEVLAAVRRSRRHPRIVQPDYAHLRRLVDDLSAAIEAIPHPVTDVLDVFCGTRPYEDLLPAGARVTGLDIDDRWGAADVVTREFLPFDDETFDLAICVEAFYYVEDPAGGVAELHRVLRPGGTVLIAVPFVWEYDRTILEHRFTEPELRALFECWEAVEVVENGGPGVAWATLSARLLTAAQRSLPASRARILRPLFALAYASVNAIAAVIERLERRRETPFRLPMNLLLTARRPSASG